MKLLLVLVAVMIGVWMWKSGRLAAKQERATRKQPPAGPTDMIGCRQCGVHVPKDDAVAGRLGLYCCAQHRHSAEP